MHACGTTLMNRMKDERCGAGRPVEKKGQERLAGRFRYMEAVAQSVMREWGQHDKNWTLG